MVGDYINVISLFISMCTIKRYGRIKSDRKIKRGCGFVNDLINKLPFELHLPGGYQYCGPGTKLKQRLARNDPGINKLDIECKKHDIQYSKHPSDLAARHLADKELEYSAWDRVKSKDASIGERAAALLVTNIMKAKRHMGMGCSTNKKKNEEK
ncbi:hypothetical protein GO639_13520 [Staphylococcus aureus]|nr:hypothetical protein [Staphylococcus aureus]